MEDRLLGGEALSEAFSDLSDRYGTIYITLLSNNRFTRKFEIYSYDSVIYYCMIIIRTWAISPTKSNIKRLYLIYLSVLLSHPQIFQIRRKRTRYILHLF